MEVSGKTRVVGIFGYPVEHTISPPMHNAAFSCLGLDYFYVPFLVSPEALGDAVAGLRAMSIRGVNITVPHKERVIPMLDRIDDEAAFIGAVNTIRNDNGVLTGFNTDGRGFMRSLREADIVVKDKRVLILGAGGAARAVGYYLCRDASRVFVHDIDREKAGLLARHLDQVRGNVESTGGDPSCIGETARGCDIIVNATPLGLKPHDPLPLDEASILPHHAVCDLIYRDTPLLRAAAGLGCRTLDGSGMLLWQGVLAFEIWTGVKPPVEVMKDALMGFIRR
jgi:shikimate dehydrogenase